MDIANNCFVLDRGGKYPDADLRQDGTVFIAAEDGEILLHEVNAKLAKLLGDVVRDLQRGYTADDLDPALVVQRLRDEATRDIDDNITGDHDQLIRAQRVVADLLEIRYGLKDTPEES